MRRVLAAVGLLLVLPALVLPPTTIAYAPCNCTAWAHRMRPDLPTTLGNAVTWGVRARRLGFRVDGTPRVGDIIVLAPGVQGAHRRYGHVAYVTGVRGGQVTVTQMNGTGRCRVTRDSYHAGRGVVFIHRR